MRKILFFILVCLFVVVRKREYDSLFNPLLDGVYYKRYQRFNPYNPLTYIFWLLVILVGMILFGIIGVWSQIQLDFKWHRFN